MALQIVLIAGTSLEIAEAALSLTVKDICLDLLPRVLQFVESIIRVLSNHTILHGTHDSDENIVLQHNPNTVSVSGDFYIWCRVPGKHDANYPPQTIHLKPNLSNDDAMQRRRWRRLKKVSKLSSCYISREYQHDKLRCLVSEHAIFLSYLATIDGTDITFLSTTTLPKNYLLFSSKPIRPTIEYEERHRGYTEERIPHTIAYLRERILANMA